MKMCVRVLAPTVALCAAMTAFAVPAHASAYRYWSYWTWSAGAWHYSTQGPSATVHAGDVIGWRFAVQANSSQAFAPRIGAVSCNAATEVGVVIDYGTTQDAPPGEHPPSPDLQQTCVSSSNSTGYRATNAAAPIRTNNSGLVCGIDGYPAHECAPIVDSPKSPTAKATTQAPSGSQARTAHRRPATGSAAAPSAGRTAHPGATGGQPTTGAPGSQSLVPSPSESPALVVSTSAPSAAHGNDRSGVPVALIVGLAIAATLGGAAVWRYRTTR